MNKKILGIKISTLLTIITCLVVSLAIWLLVEHCESKSNESEEAYIVSEGFNRL